MVQWHSIFNKENVNSLSLRVFNKIGNEWFLLSAGDINHFNTMTASWGALGVLWNKPVAMSFVRPSRHTYNFMEENEIFTMSFLPGNHKKTLNFCGATSGRDADKVKETGLLPVSLEFGGVSFEQADMVIECKKVYFDDIKPVFIIPDEVDELFYNDKDYHRMFIGEVKAVYKKTGI
ncbi:MAG: flavin reductase [Bacteroidales bacterium]|nr:flavin reductase [Bacteroidales bacterium]